MLIDSHAHLDMKEFEGDRGQVLERARAYGIRAIVNVGYDLESSSRSVALAGDHAEVYAAVGLHPHGARRVGEETYRSLRRLAGARKVVALGEMGLDYYRDLSPREVQREVFRRQIRLARELKLPIIVHDRDAHGDILNIMREEGAGEVGGVMHCFSGNWSLARECLELGFYLSIAGPVTYPNNYKTQEVARLAPLDRLLIETDAPYLAPIPFRGRVNEPVYVKLVAEKIASLRGIGYHRVAEATAANACRLFGLNLPPAG